MKIEEAVKMEEDSHKRRMKIRQKKAHDYAKKDADCLSNFKVMADIEEALEKHGYRIPIETPHGVALWHSAHKFVRILNLLNEGLTPENESIVDSFDDSVNYLDLAKECYIDFIREKKPRIEFPEDKK